MAKKSDIEEIVVSVKFQGAEKRIIYNDDKKIFSLMSDDKTLFRDLILESISSMKKDLEELKKGN